MTIKKSLVLLFSYLATSHVLAIEPVYEGPDGIRAKVLATNCLACHSFDKVDADRNGAPPEINFDTYKATRPHADRIIDKAVEEMTMPPVSSSIPALNEEQKAAMLAWQKAGFPRISTSNAFFDGSTLTVPVVKVDDQKFRATLRRIPHEGSPVGYGFVLESAELTTADSNNAATVLPNESWAYYDSTGKLLYTVDKGKQVILPVVDQLLDDCPINNQFVSVQMKLVEGSDPMVFNLYPATQERIFKARARTTSDAFYSYDNNVLSLPIIVIGNLIDNQRLKATLKLVPLESSPTGIGFVLESVSENTPLETAYSSSVEFEPETGKLHLHSVRLIQNCIDQQTVSAEMELVPGSNPWVFSLTNYAPIPEASITVPPGVPSTSN
ncbi:hypothetical protein [Methylobacter luteus]|uniref:hypothetical protein n=1 Tax=Methylobacter luteus TaxID=415 RepID=UPI0004009AA2|nr:hypothetical protein [Methylobacter luteus]